MRRDEFLVTLAAVLVGWPLTARALQPGRSATIGLLGSDTAASQSAWTAAFLQRMKELGWVEGRNLVVEYRWAEGDTDRLARLVQDLIRLKVDLILTHNTPPTLAAKSATATIPVVFATAGDAVGSGIVSSLARPGGNVTGLSSMQPDTAGKRVQFLHEVVPGLRRLGVLTDVGNPYSKRDILEVQEAAQYLGVEVQVHEVHGADDIIAGFQSMQDRVQALYVTAVPVLLAHGARINSLALAARLPTMHGVRELVESGGLMSYGPNWTDMWRRSADVVDKILRGARPGEIPVQQPTAFDFVVNLKTAKALGLAVPASLLEQATAVIQ
jgi:putative ABC transport system substrate-binding protein